MAKLTNQEPPSSEMEKLARMETLKTASSFQDCLNHMQLEMRGSTLLDSWLIKS